MPADLIDAVIAHLDADLAVTTAFDDSWSQALQTGVAKFFADWADDVPLPYCVITELGETYDFMTAATGNVINFTSPGQMLFSIYAGTRLEARQLGFVIAKALNDAPLQWPIEHLMHFRMLNSRFNPQTATGPSVPAVFNRVFIFEYTYSGAL